VTVRPDPLPPKTMFPVLTKSELSAVADSFNEFKSTPGSLTVKAIADVWVSSLVVWSGISEMVNWARAVDVFLNEHQDGQVDKEKEIRQRVQPLPKSQAGYPGIVRATKIG
jgi:hypothetical protein